MAINGVTTTPLSIIDTKGGAVLHAIKRSDHGFSGFGLGRDNSISCEVMVYDGVYNCARLAITFSDDTFPPGASKYLLFLSTLCFSLCFIFAL